MTLEEEYLLMDFYALVAAVGGSMGIFLGGMSALVPSHRGDLSKLVLRAMIAGNVACFLTGCIAGKLHNIVRRFLLILCWDFYNSVICYTMLSPCVHVMLLFQE